MTTRAAQPTTIIHLFGGGGAGFANSRDPISTPAKQTVLEARR